LILASEKGCTEIVKILLEKGADVFHQDGHYKTALDYAIENGHDDIIKLFFEKVKDNKVKSIALLNAATKGNYEFVKFLVNNKGADINAKNDKGETPLICALKNGYFDIAKFLIEKGANVNAKENIWGVTPLMYAAATHLYNSNCLNVIKLLIQKGANINAVNNQGQTALDYAGNDDIYRILRQYGAKKGIELRFR